MHIRTAWFCPSCQKHHAPHIDTCPAGSLHGGLGPFRIDIASFDPCANCKGACGNAACPKLLRVTATTAGVQ